MPTCCSGTFKNIFITYHFSKDLLPHTVSEKEKKKALLVRVTALFALLIMARNKQDYILQFSKPTMPSCWWYTPADVTVSHLGKGEVGFNCALKQATDTNCISHYVNVTSLPP